MIESNKNKKWAIFYNGALGFEQNENIVIPSAEDIYSAVFENKTSHLINEEDVTVITRMLGFSKYPIDLNIVLKSLDVDEGGIDLNIYAVTENGSRGLISLKDKLDHIVINGVWYPFMPGAVEAVLQIMKSTGISDSGKIKLGQFLSLLKLSNELVKDETKSFVQNLIFRSSVSPPDELKANLYPYQKKGWRWLKFMKDEKIGGILADEMGLGKTIQIIALLCSESKHEIFPALIVSPSTLLENWKREITKFAPHISSLIHQGPQRTGFPNELKEYDVIISSYDTIIRDLSLFCQIDWKIAVCDEAQALKNPETKRAISVKRIPRQIGFAVTGTPIENKLTDLWSIMDFSLPGYLGNRQDFELTYSQTIDGAGKLEKVITPLILRRRVTEVAEDLPPKIIIPQVLSLSENEIDQYEQIREETMKEFKSNSSLVVLTRLRMFCTHPFLIEDRYLENPTMYSNKYTRLVEIVEEIALNASKLIVFTSYNKMNDIIKTDLSSRFGMYSASIDGRTPVMERQKIVDEFSAVDGAGLLVLNPIAAGTGLNITAANHVIHYNLEWNPAKEDQASARAYRRGQNRPVTIHRLYYENTVEEIINERLTRKRSLAGTAIIGVQGEQDDYDDILKSLQKSPR